MRDQIADRGDEREIDRLPHPRGEPAWQHTITADREIPHGAGHAGEDNMREYGSVSIPQEAFIATLRMGDEG